jgi:hypothetical protein
MAAFRAICRGERLILSDWGGHSNYKEDFKINVEFVDVIQGDEKELTCSPLQIKDAILKTLKKTNIDTISIKKYEEDNISEKYRNLLYREPSHHDAIVFTSEFYSIIERRKKFFEHPTKIFADYQDELALLFLKTYGLRIK